MSNEGKRIIARFNLNLIFLIAMYIIAIWCIFNPIKELVLHFEFGLIFDTMVEIFCKIIVVLISVFISMLINCYFFTNAFDKD